MSVPSSIWQGSFNIFGVEVRCHVLSDGRRIVEAESFNALLLAMASDSVEEDHDAINAFATWQAGH